MASSFADLFTDERVKTLSDSDQVSALRDKMLDLERKRAQLEKQLEETSKVAQVLAGEKEEVERSLKLQLEVLAAKEKYSQSQAEVMKLKMELDALGEEKEAATKAFDAKKAEMVLELEDLKRRMEEIQANKGLVDTENDKLGLEVLSIEQKHRLSEAEVERLKVENDKLRSEVALMKSKIEALENYNAEKDGEIGKLNAALEEEKKKRGVRAIFSTVIRCLPSCISK